MRWLLAAALLLGGVAQAEDGVIPPPNVPWCDGATLLVPRDGEVPTEIPLPAPCLQSATDGTRTAVALGEAGAALVEHADPSRPTVVLVPTVGIITGVDFDDGALAVTEAVSVVRSVVVSDAGEVLVPTAPAPEPEPVVVDAPLPIVEHPDKRARVGAVARVQGRRAVVARDAGTAAPPDGALVAVVRPSQQTSVVDGRVRPGRKGRAHIVEVDAVTDAHLVLLLGRGDVVRRGDVVYWGGNTGARTARIVGPKPWRNQLSFVLEPSPGFSASVWSPGSHVQGRLRVAYALPVPVRFEVGLEHFSLGFVPDGQPFVGGDVQVTAELDLAPFGLGISGGYQSLGLDHTGGTIGGYLRGGFRDGLHMEVRARFVIGGNNAFGGVEGRGVIPFSDSVGLSLEGGGGSRQGFGRIGIVLHPFGQGGPGTLILNPSLGMQIMGWTGLSDRGDPWSGSRVNHVGPAVSVRVEWRP